MAKERCPSCNSPDFRVRDPEDRYNYFEFRLKEGEPEFEGGETPPVDGETEVLCNLCTWRGKLKNIAG